MSITQSVTTIFKSKDETSKNFNRMGKNAKKFGETSSRAFKKASKSATSFGTITKGILAAGAIQKAGGLAARGIGAATRGFLDFDQAITSASAKFSDLNLSTKAGQKTLLELKKTARAVGATTEFSADQAAAGLDFLALAGFKTAQAMALLPGVTNLATVANVDLATATDIASDSLGAFGLMTKNTEQLTKNFTRVQDVMAKTTASSNTNLTDLFESVKKGAPAFSAAGQSMETFAALAGEMANSGVKGSESGTQLRNVMLRLAKPTKESAALLKDMKVKTADVNGNFRDAIDILADFEKGLKGMGTKQKSAALATVFGARSVTGINILLKTGTQRLRSYRQMLIDSSGAAEKMANIMRSSLINRLKSLGSAALEVGFQFFDAFDEQGAGAIDALTKAIRKIDLTSTIENIKSVARGAMTLFDIIKTATPFFIPFVAAYAAWVATLKIQAALSAETGIFAMAKAIRAAGIAQWFLNTAMMANPVGLMIAGVTLLVAGLITTIIYWKEIWGWISKIASKIEAFTGIGSFFKEAFDPSGAKVIQPLSEKQPFPIRPKEKEERQPFPARIPPNQTELESRQFSSFRGQLDITGAPEGSSFKSKSTGPDEIDVSMLGVPQFG